MAQQGVKCVHVGMLAAALAVIYVCATFKHDIFSHYPATLAPCHTTVVTKNYQDTNSTAPYETFYNEIKCITERCNAACSFPLLDNYHERCGYFAESTSWENIEGKFPKAVMSAHMCKVPPVTSAPQRLQDFIKKRKITSIVSFGDSQAVRYNNALLSLFKQASYKCQLKKAEKTGFNIQLDYYTRDSGFLSNAIVERTCSSCNSNLHICSDTTNGHKIAIEYLSHSLTSAKPIVLKRSVCQKSKIHHPLCLNLTPPEYLFKYYLNKSQNYPELLLIFSTFGHDRDQPLAKAYDGIKYLMNMTRLHVPQSSDVIWYNAPPWHAKNLEKWSTSEGQGYNANQKVQAENHFLSRLVNDHRASGRSPRIHSFFDLYHMQEQLKQKWAQDHIHSVPAWYNFVMGYTAAMLPSLL